MTVLCTTAYNEVGGGGGGGDTHIHTKKKCQGKERFSSIQPASTQFDVDPVCVPIELMSTYFYASNQCDVDPVCVSIVSQPTSTCLNPV